MVLVGRYVPYGITTQERLINSYVAIGYDSIDRINKRAPFEVLRNHLYYTPVNLTISL
jgi:hypothetical protein